MSISVEDSSTEKSPMDNQPAGKTKSQHIVMRWVYWSLAITGGIMVLAMMLLTVTDVLGRYLFNKPLLGAGELTELLLVSVIYLGLPAVTLQNEHVSVDILADRFPAWTKPLRLIIIGVVNMSIMGIISWRLWHHAAQISAYGDVTTTLRLSIAPVAYFCAICAFISAIIAVSIPLAPYMSSFLRHSKGKKV